MNTKQTVEAIAKMDDALSAIKGISFASTAQLKREWHIPERLSRLIIRQPGYEAGAEMAVTQTASGGWRLYRRINGEWMDASLYDMDIAASNAGAALGSRTSKRKAASSAANGKLGGRGRTREQRAREREDWIE